MIYCVEDDAAIRELMVYALNASGFRAEGFPEGAPFFAALAQHKPELIMLDVMLPGGMDGIAILKKLRSQAATRDIPVIMASAKGTEYDKVLGLDLGADDYLAKPFGMMEMVSRVKAVMRRSAGGQTSTVLRAAGIELDPGAHAVTVEGAPVQLTLKEFELLRALMEKPGQVFTREQLMSTVWGSDFIGETRTVDVHVGTLRSKLGASGDAIRTVRGVGYRLEPGL